MKGREIKVGGIYIADVRGETVRVQVDEIYKVEGAMRVTTCYAVTVLGTGQELIFKSTRRFRYQTE